MNDNFLKSLLSFVVSVCLSMTFSEIQCQESPKIPELDKMFNHYEILEIDARSIHQQVRSSTRGDLIKLKINEQTEWNLILQNSEIISPEYFVIVSNENGLTKRMGTTAIPMKGTVQGVAGSQVSLTFNTDFIYGFIKMGQSTYFIEPLRHYTDSSVRNNFVIYSVNDIKPGEEKICGYDEYLKGKQKVVIPQNPVTGNRMPGGCYTVDYAIASDFSMRSAYGSITGVENHNIGVLNNVQTNYDNEFADEIQFQLNQQWISDCSGCDPWLTTTDAGDLLDSFQAWGPGGFSASHDIGSLWTRRNFNGSTIGIAFLNALCSPWKYNALQDFSSNAELKRCLASHEIGHNFNANHNTDIMAPSVSSSNTWSSTSVSQIQSKYLNVNCLSSCQGTAAPNASFNYYIGATCAPVNVDFYNQSSGATNYLWSFPGGNPSTSTELSPTVSYSTEGQYQVTLTAFNGTSSNTFSTNVTVSVFPTPTANFSHITTNGNTFFTYTGNYADNFIWNFGDGSGLSYEQNPTHQYVTNGNYNVTLMVSNSCGSNHVSLPVNISLMPAAQFSGNLLTGCQPFTVNFSNLSTNATTYVWTFEGGNPVSSTAVSPAVIYSEPGLYSVTLQATNSVGSVTTIKTNYINVKPNPIADFTYFADGPLVAFNNTGQFGTSYTWNFGDSSTSNLVNPNHTYTNNGTYTVTQTVTNSCGSDTKTVLINIASPPEASFTPNGITAICAGDTVWYQSTSAYGPETYLWTFEGGIPATSGDPDPMVVYPVAGIFEVNLSVSNINGISQSTASGLVAVNSKPSVSFTHLNNELTVGFIQNIQNGSNPVWDFGDEHFSTEINPTHSYSSEGAYVVKLTDSNACGVTIHTQIVVVQNLPTVSFNSNATNICEQSQIQFNSQTPSTVTTWEWTFEGGTPSVSNLPNPVVQYNQEGDYPVTLLVTNNEGQATLTLMDFIKVKSKPTATFTFEIESNLISLQNSGQNANDHLWSIFNEQINTQLSGAQTGFTAPENGSYLVSLTNSNLCGQTTSDTLELFINAYPSAVLGLSNESPVCADYDILFENLSQNIETNSWIFEGGQPSTSTDQNPMVRYNASGSYPVKLIVTNALGSDTLESLVQINSEPLSDFQYQLSGSETVNFEFTGSGQTSLIWDFGDGSGSAEIAPTHTYNAVGSFDVTLIAINECGRDTVIRTVNIMISGVEDVLNSTSKLSVSPNPGNGNFEVQIKSLNEGYYKITIYDILGRSLHSKQIYVFGEECKEKFELSHLNSGMYLLTLDNEKLKLNTPFFIAK